MGKGKQTKTKTKRFLCKQRAKNLQNGASKWCTVVLDSASQRSYVSKRLARELWLKKIDTENLSQGVFGQGARQKPEKRDLVEFQVGRDGKSKKLQTYVQDYICSPLGCQEVEKSILAGHKHLNGLKIIDTFENDEKSIDILIGLDYYYDIVLPNYVKGREGPTAIETIFGYILGGPIEQRDQGRGAKQKNSFTVTNTFKVSLNEGSKLNETLNRFWEIESLGIKPMQNVDELIDQSIEFRDGKYAVNLPKKENHPFLGDNYQNAKNRLFSLKRKFQKNPKLGQEYTDIIDEQLQNGTIEKVRGEGQVGKTFYLPHSAVLKPGSSTTKLRVVYDGSAKGDAGVSLNQILEKGNPRFTDLFAVLLRARTHPVVLFADIEKAFLQVGIKEEDRDLLRFLYFEEGNEGEEKIVTYRFKKVCFGLVCSMTLLGNVIREHLSKYISREPSLVKKIEQGLYVDDLSTGCENEEEGWDTYLRVRQIFKEGGFNIRKWKSNSKLLNERFERAENKGEMKGTALDDSTIASILLGQNDGDLEKVLGIDWDSDTDEFVSHLKNTCVEGLKMEKTKRNLLALAASVYDPFGFLSPIILPLKVMFQNLCKDGGDWDEILKEKYIKDWMEWCQRGIDFEGMRIPRFILSEKGIKEAMLVGFSDASKTAYAGVLYLVMKDAGGRLSLIY